MAPGSIQPSGPVDQVHLGRRLRGARRTIGKAVAALAEETGLAPELIEDIEAGRVLPDERALTVLARHTQTSPDTLVSGPDAAALVDILGYLDNAELLHSSHERTGELLRAADCALDRLAGGAAPEVVRTARRLRATALERSGNLEGAISELLVVTAEPLAETQWLTDLIALSRCYRESGHLHRAIDVGESRREEIHALGLADSAEAIRLTVTVAGAYIFRAAEGDLGHATRLCLRAATTRAGQGRAGAR
ncbi:helix-turn-helix domain-containing protein, partial [Nocardioides daeguensis]|uniref:helix-turn-helix domain-containing protein n=1 Tax=Nocardioides daeguensis TaxID=908359 RepID=UPI001C45D6BA